MDDGHLSASELKAGLAHILASPREQGVLEMIVRRPGVDRREELARAELCVELGLCGDGWRARGSDETADGSAHPDMQIALMNARVAQLVAGSRERWPLAGDQLYVDLDLSESNMPPGTRLTLGEAVLEVTSEPHVGCHKFVRRFGRSAMVWVNSVTGRKLNLRGLYARVIQGGAIVRGQPVRRL